MFLYRLEVLSLTLCLGVMQSVGVTSQNVTATHARPKCAVRAACVRSCPTWPSGVSVRSATAARHVSKVSTAMLSRCPVAQRIGGSEGRVENQM